MTLASNIYYCAKQEVHLESAALEIVRNAAWQTQFGGSASRIDAGPGLCPNVVQSLKVVNFFHINSLSILSS